MGHEIIREHEQHRLIRLAVRILILIDTYMTRVAEPYLLTVFFLSRKIQTVPQLVYNIKLGSRKINIQIIMMVQYIIDTV